MRRILLWAAATVVVVGLAVAYQIGLPDDGDKHGRTGDRGAHSAPAAPGGGRAGQPPESGSAEDKPGTPNQGRQPKPGERK